MALVLSDLQVNIFYYNIFDISIGIDIENVNFDILNELPEDLQELKPLLNGTIFHSQVFKSNKFFESLPSNGRMVNTINLLCSIIEIYVRQNPKNTVIFL